MPEGTTMGKVRCFCCCTVRCPCRLILFRAWLTLRPRRWSWYVSPKRRQTTTKLYDIITQKTMLFIDTTVKTLVPNCETTECGFRKNICHSQSVDGTVRRTEICRPWRTIGLWDVEAPTFSRQSAHRFRWGYQPYAPAVLYPQEDFWYSFQLEAESTPGS
jgi:hypothetical protein